MGKVVKRKREAFRRRYMTREETARYVEEFYRSESFDVHPPRGVLDCGLLGPVNRPKSMERHSRRAIEKYNHLVEGDEKIPRLEFVKVLRAMMASFSGSRFFITFEAKEEDSAGGQTKTYQTVVHKPLAGKPPRVLSFRECEVEQGTGNIRGKEWRWKGHGSGPWKGNKKEGIGGLSGKFGGP